MNVHDRKYFSFPRVKLKNNTFLDVKIPKLNPLLRLNRLTTLLLIGFVCVKEEIRNDKGKRHKNLVYPVFTSLLQIGEGAILTGAGLCQQSTRVTQT